MEKSIKTGYTYTHALYVMRGTIAYLSHTNTRTHALTHTNVKRKYQKEHRRCSGQEERGVIDKPQQQRELRRRCERQKSGKITLKPSFNVSCTGIIILP